MKTKLSLILVTVFLLAACGPKAGTTTAATIPPVSQPTATSASSATAIPAATSAPLSGNVDVTIADFAFSPDKLTVKVGTTVKWTNKDSATHTVTAEDNSFSSGDLDQGSSFSFTFNTPGTYPYRCGLHARMKGTITVVP